MVIGAKYCAPLGVHGNVVKLISSAYGQILNQLRPADKTRRSARRADGTDKAWVCGLVSAALAPDSLPCSVPSAPPAAAAPGSRPR